MPVAIDEDRLKEMWTGGEKLATIKKELEIGVPTLYYYLGKLGLEMRGIGLGTVVTKCKSGPHAVIQMPKAIGTKLKLKPNQHYKWTVVNAGEKLVKLDEV